MPRDLRTPRVAASIFLFAVLLALAACTSTPPEPLPITPPGDAASAPVVRRVAPDTNVIAAPTKPAEIVKTVPSLAPIGVPANAQYVCVTDISGERQQIAIAFVPKVAALCRKHPEMGPCQYEREACRRSGGRVFAANGVEITKATEAEYDKHVLRVRFQAN
jgi:hypothetical protein